MVENRLNIICQRFAEGKSDIPVILKQIGQMIIMKYFILEF